MSSGNDGSGGGKSRFPTPPQMTPVAASSTSTNASASRSSSSAVPSSSGRMKLPLPPPPPPPRSTGVPTHTSNAPIPDLSSAPPSGNFNSDELAIAMQNSQEQVQSQMSSLSTSNLALPPPPKVTTASTRTPLAAPPPSVQQQSSSSATMAPLPPPPTVTALPTTKTSATPAASTSSSGWTAGTPSPTVSRQPPTPGAAPVSPTPSTSTEAKPPRPLPPITFASPNMQLLAKRQTHLSILVIGTEKAHKLAWKNGLQLCDLLEGLMVRPPSSNQSVPFRSINNKSLQVSLDQVQVTFLSTVDADNADTDDDTTTATSATDASTGSSSQKNSPLYSPGSVLQPIQDDKAQIMLQQYANVMEQDGNLAQELELLEDQVDNLLTQATNSDDDSNENQSLVDRQVQLEQVTKDAYALTSPLSIPWLWRYRHALDVSTNANGYDLFACPAICLLICTTQEDYPLLDTLQNLASPHYLPRPFHNGLLDPNVIRHEALILHDTIDGPRDWDEGTLRQSLQRVFGPNANVVRINSINVEAAAMLAEEEHSDLWGGGGKLGTCLSVSDRVVLRKFLTNLITASVLPALERRVSDLNVIVSDRKKGMKNVFKNLWGGGRVATGSGSGATGSGVSQSSAMAGTGSKGSSLDEDDSTMARYRYDSIESQTRLLADTLFLLKDYESALSMYRLIKDDFKQDKANGHYGSVQEMIALCMYLTDSYGRARDIFSYFENALLSYSRAAEEERPSSWGEKPGRPSTATMATRLATRLCLVMISTQNVCNDRHLEVADLLASASSHETSLGAAVLLEQSSSHYFHAGMYRKYAFHMLMSGHMFRSAEQEHHAFRCFTSALYIYRDSKWEELHNHLKSALAAQLYSMGRMAVSLQLYAKLVGSTEGGRVSSKSQQKFINHLLEICNEHPKKALVGADRMAAPSKLPYEKRDAVRKERLDRIVQVVRYTRSASRVLELPNIELPGVDDNSVVVITDSSAHNEWIPSFGASHRGSSEVWDDLMLMTTAELKANDKSVSSSIDDQAVSSALSKISDPVVRRVLAAMDKEKMSRSLSERAKKSANYKASPPVRAQMEPLEVEFAISNPLAIPIDLSDLQIVAKMTDENGVKVCTNEDAIKITPLVSYDAGKQWTFHGSNVKFVIPDFCRVSSGSADDGKQSWKAGEETDPFFVVTKANLTLEAECRRTISASICPLVRGNLEIIGVRCRLLDDVWVFHPFDLKGPLLQNTRENRANRVRAESTVLKAKVERGMPCLTSELFRDTSVESDDPGPTLQGQVGSWILRLSNVGTAPACRPYLKTNVPWVCIVDTEPKANKSDDQMEKEGVPFCVGPTGTLMELPIRGRRIKRQGELQPGEVVDIQIKMRPSGVGRQDFYMLFRYQLLEEEPTATPRYRWLRKMFEVPVYPSLSLSATVIPSFSDHSEHILSFELTNNRTERPDKLGLILNKLRMASRRYQLIPLAGQFGEGDSGSSSARLGWQERVSVHYKVVPVDESESACILSECSFTSKASSLTKKASSSHLLHFLCLERTYQSFDKTLKSHQMALVRAAAAQGDEGQQPRSIAQIRRANTSSAMSDIGDDVSTNSDDCHPASVLRLCPLEDPSVALVCSWRDEEGKIVGEHYLRDLSIRPPVRSRGCPITVTARHAASVTSNLSEGPAEVPMEVVLRNRLVHQEVSFRFVLDKPETFDFVGPECFHSALSAGEELSVPVRARIPSTGVFNLQKIRLTIEEEDSTSISYVFPMQWMVTVSSA